MMKVAVQSTASQFRLKFDVGLLAKPSNHIALIDIWRIIYGKKNNDKEFNIYVAEKLAEDVSFLSCIYTRHPI